MFPAMSIGPEDFGLSTLLWRGSGKKVNRTETFQHALTIVKTSGQEAA